MWGFSFLQLYIVLVLLTVWTLGTYILWLKAHLTLAQRNDSEIPVKFKATLHLVSIVNKEFAVIGEEPSALTNRQLNHCIISV